MKIQKYFKRPIKLVTHFGNFHADDCFATAALQIYFDKIGRRVKIIRTRDAEIIKSADIVYDVGDVYDPATNRFDHHQVGGAGARENGVPYSSFGLIWKHYGEKICANSNTAVETNIAVAKLVDERLIQCIDSVDNAYETFESVKGIDNFTIDDLLKSFIPNREEKKEGDDVHMESFLEAVSIARRVLERVIKRAKLTIADEAEVEKVYAETVDKRIIIFDKQMSWTRVLCSKPEPLYVVQTKYGTDYAVSAVPISPVSFKLRKPFPLEWRGKRSDELVRISGIKTANFCHQTGFLCNTKTREDAILLAQKAVDA